MSNVDFENIKTAFAHKNQKELEKAYQLFSLFNIKWLNSLLSYLGNLAFKMNLPVSWMLKENIFAHFCGGESIYDCESTVELLFKHKVESNLDYSVEATHGKESFDATRDEIVANVTLAGKHESLTFTSLKITGLGEFKLLEKYSSGENLNIIEQEEWQATLIRLDNICRKAHEQNIKVFIDAEESWIQPAIDDLADEMMSRYNKESSIVYNTYQMYRHDRLAFLKASHKKAANIGYILGAKLVRGAYMEKESERATEKGYINPICSSKEDTDNSFDSGCIYCLENLNQVHLVVASHNESSNKKVTNWMTDHNVDLADRRVYFAQLYGMSDHISFNLADAGYKVCKYIPYGPIKYVLPYLIRRAQENTSIEGQMGRELSLIKKELQRRKVT